MLKVFQRRPTTRQQICWIYFSRVSNFRSATFARVIDRRWQTNLKRFWARPTIKISFSKIGSLLSWEFLVFASESGTLAISGVLVCSVIRLNLRVKENFLIIQPTRTINFRANRISGPRSRRASTLASLRHWPLLVMPGDRNLEVSRVWTPPPLKNCFERRANYWS